MTRKIVLIESDATLVQAVRAEFEPRGFQVVDTSDGRSAPELVRREQPDGVVLAVELAAGQSGYIVCGKLKKDDDLKRIPVIIVGRDAEGFEAHRRLKARAEEYLKKPFSTVQLRERVFAMLGLSDSDAPAPGRPRSPASPPPVIQLTAGDPDLEMLDAAFESIAEGEAAGEALPATPSEAGGDDALIEPIPTPAALRSIETPAALLDDFGADRSPLAAAPGLEVDDATAVAEPLESDAFEPLDAESGSDAPAELDALQGSGGEALAPLDADAAFAGSGDLYATGAEAEPVEEEEVSLDALEVEELPPLPQDVRFTPQARPSRAAAAASVDDGEVRELRARLADLDARQRDLEDELAARSSELEALRSTAGGRDRDLFALRDQITRKDKEIVRLRGELNEQEQSSIDRREREGTLEQRCTELTTEAARREAQLKLLTQRTDTLLAERRRFESALAQAKDEIRQLSTALATAQGELDQAQESALETHRDLESARAAVAAHDREQHDHAALQDENRALADERARLEQENAELRARIAELEQASARNEDRVLKAYQKIKAEEKARDKTRRALASALQQLDEAGLVAGEEAEPGTDPEAEA